ncbi:hypothetical protein OSTOST_00920 [Ostertagia ostertagi]
MNKERTGPEKVSNSIALICEYSEDFWHDVGTRMDDMFGQDVEIHNGVMSFEDIRVEADGVQYNVDNRSEQPSRDFAERVVHYPDLAKSVDRSIDPCEDFYSFVCNGWIKSHPIPENQFQYTQTELSKEKIIKEVKEPRTIFRYTSYVTSYTTREDNLMRIFYEKCVRNTLQPDNNGMSMLFSKLRITSRLHEIANEDAQDARHRPAPSGFSATT